MDACCVNFAHSEGKPGAIHNSEVKQRRLERKLHFTQKNLQQQTLVFVHKCIEKLESLPKCGKINACQNLVRRLRLVFSLSNVVFKLGNVSHLSLFSAPRRSAVSSSRATWTRTASTRAASRRSGSPRSSATSTSSTSSSRCAALRHVTLRCTKRRWGGGLRPIQGSLDFSFLYYNLHNRRFVFFCAC